MLLLETISSGPLSVVASANSQIKITDGDNNYKSRVFQQGESSYESDGNFKLTVFLDGFLGAHNPVAICVTVLASNIAKCKTFDLYNLTEQQFPGEQDTGHKLDVGLFEFPIINIPLKSYLEACLIDLISHTVGCTATRYDGATNSMVDIDIDSMESEQ